MIDKLKRIRDKRGSFFYDGSGTSKILDSLIDILIECEEAKHKAIGEMQKKCKSCTAPHCGLCEKFINVVKKC